MLRASLLTLTVTLVVFTLPVLALNSPTPSDSPKIDKSLIEAIAKHNLGKVSKDAQSLVDQMNRDEAKAKRIAEEKRKAEEKRIAEEKAKAEAARIEAERLAAVEAARVAEEARLAQVAAEQSRAAQQAQRQAPAVAYGSGCDWLTGQLRAHGIAEGDIPAAIAIAQKESGCRQSAVNPDGGACNVFQELPCGKWGGSGDLAGHIRGADNYAKQRYGGWWAAYNEWQIKRWW